LYLQNKGLSVFDVGAWRSGASIAELSFSTDSGSDAAPVERMRIDSSGNVGIGTTNPSAKLEVSGTDARIYLTGGNTDINMDNSASGQLSLDGNGYAFGIALNANGANLYTNSVSRDLIFGVNETEVMRVTDSNVGIGTSSPAMKLDISGTSYGGVYIKSTSTNYSGIALENTNSATKWQIGVEGGTYHTAGKLNIGIDAVGSAIIIDSSRNVGIGTSSPASFTGKLVVNTGTNKNINLRAGIRLAGSSIQSIQDDAATDSPLEIFCNSAQLQLEGTPITFYSGGERMRIDSSGNVLVGKTTLGYTTPGVRLAGQGYASNFAHNTAFQTNILFSAPVSQAQVSFYRQDTGAGMGSITNGATNSVSYNTSSDYRLKEDWQPMSGSVDRVKALKPVNFAWKADGSRVDGFLAHEAQAVVPEAVTGTKDAVDAEGKPDYQGIDQSKLVPLLTAALQEALAAIEALTARVSALEGN
jgi:hypothetical protein